MLLLPVYSEEGAAVTSFFFISYRYIFLLICYSHLFILYFFSVVYCQLFSYLLIDLLHFINSLVQFHKEVNGGTDEGNQ